MILQTGLRTDIPAFYSRWFANRLQAGCACYLGNDIGAYDTCRHLCRYCYANANAAAVRQNMRLHHPE